MPKNKIMSCEPNLVEVSFASPDEAMEFVRKLYGQSCLFPVAEALDVSFRQQTIGEMTLTTATTSSGFGFHTPDCCRSQFLFIAPKTGTLSIGCGLQRLAIGPNRAFIGNLAETDVFELSAGVSKTALSFPHAVVQHTLSRWLGYEAGELVRFEPEIDLTGGFGRQLSWLLNEVTGGLGDGTVSVAHPLAAHQLSNAVLTLFLHGTPHSYRAKLAFDATPVSHHPRKIRDAMNYIETHLHQPITVSDIAEAIGLTPRAFSRGSGTISAARRWNMSGSAVLRVSGGSCRSAYPGSWSGMLRCAGASSTWAGLRRPIRSASARRLRKR
ncbi:MAG: AraC family transcriptional regulator [Blastochloris sp.]|nr:AraC family transcriptional regulator [Blastochloris sp.]